MFFKSLSLALILSTVATGVSPAFAVPTGASQSSELILVRERIQAAIEQLRATEEFETEQETRLVLLSGAALGAAGVTTSRLIVFLKNTFSKIGNLTFSPLKDGSMIALNITLSGLVIVIPAAMIDRAIQELELLENELQRQIDDLDELEHLANQLEFL